MKNIKKIANEMLSSEVEYPQDIPNPTCEENILYSEAAVKTTEIRIPISIEYIETQFGQSNIPRVTVNLTDIAVELEKKFDGAHGRTEISRGKDNLIHFDLEAK
jgi:hypothetical protein